MVMSSVLHPGVRRAADSRWVERAGRAGFAARGLVYLVVAVIAARVAIHSAAANGEQANKQGALRALADTSFGGAALVFVAVGFAGLALWRLTEALTGHREESGDKKRSGKRIASGAKAAMYASFAVSTVAFLAGKKTQGGDVDSKSVPWTARLMQEPGGRWLVALAGIVLVGGGIYLGVRGATKKFEKHLRPPASPAGKKAVAVLGIFGMCARGFVIGCAGAFLLKAAADFDPRNARGLDGTLRAIADRPYGQVLLLLTALGIAAFGLFSFCEARYREL